MSCLRSPCLCGTNRGPNRIAVAVSSVHDLREAVDRGCWPVSPQDCNIPGQIGGTRQAATRIVLLHFVAMARRSEEHTSELQSLMRSSYAVFCLKKKNNHQRESFHTYH